ncbi:MAG TPA: universal stress protein [Desulfuromonadales bacterium]|nr:universal stress protein [Desulfuromonadales bacterium]
MKDIPISNIVYATDFSGSSKRAAAYAANLAKLTGATLHLLHVINELSDEQRSLIQQDLFDSFAKDVEVLAVKNTEEFRRKYFAGIENIRSHTVIGTPFQQIINHSEELQADLIVMGTHGRTGIEHVLVGSTAERVVRRSRIPVLTVRGE